MLGACPHWTSAPMSTASGTPRARATAARAGRTMRVGTSRRVLLDVPSETLRVFGELVSMTVGTASSETWHERCVICSSSRLDVLVGYEHAHLMRCRGCGMVFAARIPTDTELAAHYRDYGHAWHDSPITRRRYAEVLDSLEPYRIHNRLLDVGCGAGYFLEEARRRDWEVHGTEYSGLALELTHAKGLDVVPAPLGRGTCEPHSFDVVT